MVCRSICGPSIVCLPLSSPARPASTSTSPDVLLFQHHVAFEFFKRCHTTIKQDGKRYEQYYSRTGAGFWIDFVRDGVLSVGTPVDSIDGGVHDIVFDTLQQWALNTVVQSDNHRLVPVTSTSMVSWVLAERQPHNQSIRGLTGILCEPVQFD